MKNYQLSRMILVSSFALFSFMASFAQTVKPLTVSEYTAQLSASLNDIGDRGLMMIGDTLFPGVMDTDITGFQQIATDKEGTNYLFYTVVVRDGKPAGVLIGYPVPKGVFTVLYTLEGDRAKPYPDLGVYLISGLRLGNMGFDAKGSGTLVKEPSAKAWIGGGGASGILDWLACTADCIGDANLICKRDPKCSILVIAANMTGTMVGAGPLGSISIAAACGALCTKDPKLDLVPGY